MVLVKEEENVQKPIYYMSRTLRGVETCYRRIDMLAFSPVTTVFQLRPYFKAYSIKVLTEAPLKKVFQKPNTSRRLMNFSIELREFDIEYLLVFPSMENTGIFHSGVHQFPQGSPSDTDPGKSTSMAPPTAMAEE